MKTATPYGFLLAEISVDCVNGSIYKLQIINPFAFLHVAMMECLGFARFMANRLLAKPSSYEKPWRFVLYSDEVVPGNQLSFHNLRKCWVVDWSFIEFGVATLADEDAWFCIAAIRSDLVKHMKGGMAQVIGAILKFLFAAGVHSLQTGGVLLKLPGGGSHRQAMWKHPALYVYVSIRRLVSDARHCFILCEHPVFGFRRKALSYSH